METTKILSASFLDILFDGRNKEYGAYELRTTYESRLWQALAITAGVFLLIGGAAWLKTTLANEAATKVNIVERVVIKSIDPEVDKPKPPKPVEPPKTPEVPKVKTVALVTPVVVKDKDVVEPPPTQTDLVDARISNITQDGTRDLGVVIPPKVLDGDRGIVPVSKPEFDEDVIVSDVNIEASYLGGADAWRRFLERNLRGEVPVDNNASPGSYTVIIQFVVDKEGIVSDLKPLTKLGYGMEEEAIRVIRRSGKWRPAIYKNKEVKAYRKQPITFRVLEQ